MSDSNLLQRPVTTPVGRWGPSAAPAMAPGPQLPSYAMPSPNRLQAPQAPQAPTGPAVIQPALHPPEPPRSSYGLEHQVSTRIPTSLKLDYDPHTRNDQRIETSALSPDLDQPGSGKAAERRLAYHNDLIRRMRSMYPHVNTANMSNDEAQEAFMGHLHDNIVGLWNQIRDKPWLQDTVHWYWGANKYAHDIAKKYATHVPDGISHRQAAAMIATLSPQTDWNQNVNRVERMLDIVRDHKNTPFDDRMRDFVRAQMLNRKDPKMQQKGLDQLAQIADGASFKDLKDPLHQAFFTRAHDELYNPDRTYPIFSPSGERFPHPKGYRVGWGSFDELRNAFQVLQKDELPNISRALGDKHKVRSFYNNIIAPDSPDGHVTIDTHAINAAQLMPMGSHHVYVAHGLGSGGMPHNNELGGHGLYAMYADAYRRAANTISRLEGRRYLPREVQSATWEAVKGLFDREEFKKQQPAFLDKAKTTPNPEAGEPAHHVGKVAKHFWNFARYGVISPATAREAVYNAAGRVSDPEWWQQRQAQRA